MVVALGAAREAYAWLAVGDSYEAVKGLHAFVIERRPQALPPHGRLLAPVGQEGTERP